MAFNNSCTFVGRIAEPTFREITKKSDNSSTLKADVGLAVQNGYKKDTPPIWVNLEVWGALAEVLQKYAGKGSKIGVRCEFKVDEFEVDGNRRTKPVFVVRDLELLNTNAVEQSEDASSDAVADEDDDELPPF
jgi:single-stranded DNA-binding protein